MIPQPMAGSGDGNPPIMRFGPAVMLSSTAVLDAALLIKAGLNELERRNAIAARPQWLALLRALERAGAEVRMSGVGHADSPQDPDQQESVPEDLISTREAAAIMQLTERQTRRLADSLGARRAGKALVFDRDLVLAEAYRRQEMSA